MVPCSCNFSWTAMVQCSVKDRFAVIIAWLETDTGVVMIDFSFFETENCVPICIFSTFFIYASSYFFLASSSFAIDKASSVVWFLFESSYFWVWCFSSSFSFWSSSSKILLLRLRPIYDNLCWFSSSFFFCICKAWYFYWIYRNFSLSYRFSFRLNSSAFSSSFAVSLT